MHHLIFITSARCASVGTDYLQAFVNTVADWQSCPAGSAFHARKASILRIEQNRKPVSSKNEKRNPILKIKNKIFQIK
ncbi:hypothetical protein [Methanimicrococcus hacksteinii]|uniref:hypothetical protein n=1 Tax=Methanimicrococcus hacksteinii TaxID=3028293 RepID=UPI00298F3C6E|nr:hypothetical protein [Methanimicrococcus sp. At1]